MNNVNMNNDKYVGTWVVKQEVGKMYDTVVREIKLVGGMYEVTTYHMLNGEMLKYAERPSGEKIAYKPAVELRAPHTMPSLYEAMIKQGYVKVTGKDVLICG